MTIRGGILLKNVYRVYLSGADYRATGDYNIETNQLTVHAGSQIKSDENASLRKYYENVAKIKDELIEKGIIVDDQFTVDYKFDHVFHASAIVSSYGKAGRKSWKLRDGRTIETLEQNQKNIEQFLTFYNDYTIPDLDAKRRKEEKTVREFQELFPLERLKNLTLEEYDSRGSKQSLTYMIEHGTNEIFRGSLGNNKNKLFFQLQDNTYDCSEYFKNRFPGESIEEMFEYYRNSLYKLVSEFNKETYTIAPPRQANTIKGKLLMLYHPGELLHFNSRAGYQKLYEFFGLDPSDKDSIMLNIEMQQFLRNIGVQIEVTETSRKLWIFYDEQLRERKKTETEVEREISYAAPNFEHIFLADDFIAKIVRVLKRKKAIILKGVPGVGKTFVIRDILAKSFANIGDDGIEMIQFHQSYSYEEFIEGLKPQMDGSFVAEKGIFYEMVKRAEADPENNYFLIIDEINRGNISKIFGELMMLIEHDKRDDYSVRLAYSKEHFSVPSNLYVVGTMNTADRSLTLVDYALRRRFSFLTLEPAFGTHKFNTFLREKMELSEANITKINNVMKRVNNIIEDKLGKDFLIGHSYFILNDETINDFDIWYDDIVEFEIMPMIEEYFFDDEAAVRTIANILGENDA